MLKHMLPVKGRTEERRLFAFLVMIKNMLAFTHAVGDIPQIAMELASVVIASH